MNAVMKLGSFVCPKKDTEKRFPAIVVYEHGDIKGMKCYTLKCLDSSGYILFRKEEDLQEITIDDAIKVWCKKQPIQDKTQDMMNFNN
ncbi:MAG: hypothetical protein D4S01_03010 [Dehalococcoidia bacterium]|nr:MAG: hypothetical protein D4S01_03010 [Dehalococcoidia bacterium]